VLCFSRASYRYRGISGDQTELRQRIKEIAAVRVRYGYQVSMCYFGVRAGRSIISAYIAYISRGGICGQKRPKRRLSAAHRFLSEQAFCITDSWSMGFVSDGLFNGQRFVKCLFRDPHFVEYLGYRRTGLRLLQSKCFSSSVNLLLFMANY